MNPALRSLFPTALQPAFYRPYASTLHPPRRALRTSFVAAVTLTTILAPAIWLLNKF